MAPERLDAWLAGFEDRHGAVRWAAEAGRTVLTAADGARAECELPFAALPPGAGAGEPDARRAVPPGAGAGEPDARRALLAAALAERTVGVLLVRLGGHAAGVVAGSELVSSKVGRRPVHGRSAAGGSSQHRFARRREGQAREALAAAADAAARVLVPAAGRLDAVVTGGDRRAVAAVLADDRLEPLRALVVPRHLDVPDPNRRVLEAAADLARAVRIRVVDAPPAASPPSPPPAP